MLGEVFTEVANISPIPLSIIDVYTQLSAKHSSIDTVYISPFGAIALQWYNKVKYASKVPLTNAIGSLVISKRFFDKLPTDLQVILRETGKVTGQKINAIARSDNEKSIKLLEQSGIEFMWEWNDEEFKEMLVLRDKAAKKLAESGYITNETFSKTRKILDEFRGRVNKK